MSNLARIQKELKAPKDKRNTFGNYNYRSCESILEAVKPLLNGCVLTLTDDVKEVGGRVYVVATASLLEVDGNTFSVTAFAREPEEKKGMDTSQITGAASSYARKYALNGLFAIDDNQDSDNSKPEPGKQKLEKTMTAKWQNAIKGLKDGKTLADIRKVYDLTEETAKLLENESMA